MTAGRIHVGIHEGIGIEAYVQTSAVSCSVLEHARNSDILHACGPPLFLPLLSYTMSGPVRQFLTT